MSDNEKTAPDGGFLQTVSNFDWLRIPGAVRAIAGLVQGVGHAGTAWIDIAQAKGEQQAKAIRDTTLARSKALEQYAEAAIAAGIQDQGLIDRTIDYTLIKNLRRQHSREAIGRETVNILGDGEIDPESPPPDDDWMNIFVDYAEKASTERMQKHWAAILAGEIRRPGTYSFKTLQMMSLIDQDIAETIAQVSRWTIAERYVPNIGQLKRGQGYFKLVKLADFGVLSLGHSQIYEASDHSIGMPVGNQIVVFKVPKQLRLSCSLVTEPGRQILSLSGTPEPDEQFLGEFVEVLKQQGATDVSVQMIVR